MRLFLPALMLALATPALAAPVTREDKMEARGERVAEEVMKDGPLGLFGQSCKSLAGTPIWGGVRSVGKNNMAELQGTGMKIDCDARGMVENVVLTSEFRGSLPRGTTFSMKQKDVYKTLKKAGLKDKINKDKDDKGAFVRMTSGSGTVTWRWDDPKGKTAVKRVVLRAK